MADYGTPSVKAVKSVSIPKSKRKPKARKKRRMDQQASGTSFADVRGLKTTPLSKF